MSNYFSYLPILTLFTVFYAFCSTFQINLKNQDNNLAYRIFRNSLAWSEVSESKYGISEYEKEQYFGAHNIFLQPEQKYILVPALLFGTESSFKKDYQLEIVQNISDTTLPTQNSQTTQQPTLFEIYPALQKLNTYNLTAVKGLNVTDCRILQVYFEDDDSPFIVCLRKSRQLEVHRIDISDIYFQFSFKVSYLWNKMNIISTTQIFFYNESNMQFYTYNRQNDTAIVLDYKIEQVQSIKQCETYIEDNPSQSTLDDGDLINKTGTDEINQEKYYQICYTNNNHVSQSAYHKLNMKLNQIKKQYVIMFLLGMSNIQLLTSFEIPQKNQFSFNHIVGFDIIDSLQKVIMMCYNLYKLKSPDQPYQQQTQFVSSYCSIFKIYLQRNQMVLINRMQLDNTTFPLLQTSLQISVMLTVVTQKSITFYHLDVLKQRFQFIQQIDVPENSNFNCYELSQLSNSYSSVSLTCAKDQDESKTISFVMVFDEDLGKYVPVGDVFVGVNFFHSAQLIFTLNQKQMTVLKANQQYAIFDYSEDKVQVRVYEVDIQNPQQKSRYASIIMNPAEYGSVYADKVLPLIQQINYDQQYSLDLRGAFQGSNVSYLQIQVVDQMGKLVENSTMIKNNKIYFYEYSLLVSVYIKEECIRIIKICDISFYRILQIQKSRVVDLNGSQEYYANYQENQQTSQDGADQYYYYTEICNLLQGYYICELIELNSPPQALIHKIKQAPDSEPNVLRIQSNRKSKLIGIQYIADHDTFVYLYEQENNLFNKSSRNHYGLMFIDLIQQNSQNSSLQCFCLQSFIQQLIPTNNLLKIQLKKDWLILKHTSGHVFCLLTQVKVFLFRDSNSNQGFSIKKSCLFSKKIEKSVQRYFVQENTLILSVTSFDSQSKYKSIMIYSIFQQQTIIKKGQCKLVEKINNNLNLQTLKDEEQFIGLYRQYIIIVNSTTIRKFYLQVDLELVFEFTFNPEFVDENNFSDFNSSNADSYSRKANSYPIKYVLFLEKYLIVQFDQFYQLYNIGEQLISIQIAANNFKTYFQNIQPQKRQKFGLLKNISVPQNVIINDAFLIEGDNIIIYEKDHLVVAKYVTNPTLDLGPTEQSQSVVETNLELRLRPISDMFNCEQVYQEILFKIIYSHYEVQNIAKNIKTLTAPSVTQNYELQIWTFVFRGPVIEYYLSDTFDGKIVLTQHLTQNAGNISKIKGQQNAFMIIQYHRPYAGKYVIKTNNSHLLIEQKDTDKAELLEIPEYLQGSLYLKQLEVIKQNGQSIICLLSIDQIIFVKKQISKSKTQESYKFWKVFDHNISILRDSKNSLPETEIQLISKISQENSFELIIRFQIEIENGSQINKIDDNNYFNRFSFIIDDKRDQLSLDFSQKVILNDQVLQIRTINQVENQNSQILVLTQTQELIFLQLIFDKKQSKYQIKQSISLQDLIPVSYRSNKRYVAFQILNPIVLYSNQTHNQRKQNKTILFFAENDEAFHIQFEMYLTINDQNSSIYSLRINNIYASYLNFNFLKVIQIGFDPKNTSGKSKKLPYLYFVVLCEQENSQTPYLFYFGYNYNYSHKGEVGYFKCGEQISVQNNRFEHIQIGQNPKNKGRRAVASLRNDDTDENNNYVYSIGSMGHIQVQILKITIQSLNDIWNRNFSYKTQVLYDKKFTVNTTIYMKMNYQKPPIVTYILMNARNFNTRAGIYTKFVFMKEEQTWTGFYITSPILLVFIVGFGWLLKKYQPKQVLRRKKPNQPQIIYSDTSRSSSSKQEKVICIEDDDSSDESSSNRQSSLDEGRFGKVFDRQKISQKSSLLESPFKSHYGSRDLQDLSESQIGHSEEVKVQFNTQEDKEILAYLISKKEGHKNIRSSFT